MQPIRTERLKLRPWRLSDVPSYAEGCNTPAVMRWLGGVQSQAAVARDVRYFIKAEERDGFTFWAIELACSKTLLGFCGLLKIRERDCPIRGQIEIGWRIRESAWRQGFAFEAASAVLEAGLNRMSIAVIVSRAAAENVASRNLMSKLGMERKRYFDYVPHGETSKLAAYSITASAWQQRLR